MPEGSCCCLCRGRPTAAPVRDHPGDLEVVPADAVKKIASRPRGELRRAAQRRAPTGHIIEDQIWVGMPEILPWGVDRIDADEV